MKKAVMTALLWAVLMFAGLVILDLVRGNDINLFISGVGAAAIFVFKTMLGIAEANAKKRQDKE